jgi:ribosome-binding factor A
MATSRPDRVGEAIRDELSQLLTRHVHDPGIGFITLTRVKVSADLQVARVYYTTLGDETAQRETAKALKRAAPFLRRQLGQRIRLRRVPEIDFFYDESIARGDRIEQILQELKAEAAARAGDAGGANSTADPEQNVQQEAAAPSEGASATEPRERSGAVGAARERAGGSGGAKPPGHIDDDSGDED